MRKKKQLDRPRIKPAVYRAEEPRIIAFCLDMLTERAGFATPIREVYEEYRYWLRARGHDDTALSLDGFGRMFPKAYGRKTVVTLEGQLSAVKDVEIRS